MKLIKVKTTFSKCFCVSLQTFDGAELESVPILPDGFILKDDVYVS